MLHILAVQQSSYVHIQHTRDLNYIYINKYMNIKQTTVKPHVRPTFGNEKDLLSISLQILYCRILYEPLQSFCREIKLSLHTWKPNQSLRQMDTFSGEVTLPI